MTLPRFNLRTGLAWLTAAAVVSVVLRSAVQGEAWALGAVTAVASVVVLLLVHAGCFVVSQLISGRGRVRPPNDPRGGGR